MSVYVDFKNLYIEEVLKNLELEVDVVNNEDSDYEVTKEPVKTIKSKIKYKFNFKINTLQRFLPVKYFLTLETEM